MELIKYKSRQEQATELARVVADELRSTLDSQELAVLCLPGGSTPSLFFHELSLQSLDWSRVVVVPNDDRVAPLDSDRSVVPLLNKNLFKNKASKAKLINILTPDLEINSELENFLDSNCIDVLVAGMGVDMHTASIFPDEPLSKIAIETEETIIRTKATIEPVGEDRVTINAKTLSSSKYIHILIAGNDKLESLDLALNAESASQAPIKIYLDQSKTQVHWSE